MRRVIAVSFCSMRPRGLRITGSSKPRHRRMVPRRSLAS